MGIPKSFELERILRADKDKAMVINLWSRNSIPVFVFDYRSVEPLIMQPEITMDFCKLPFDVCFFEVMADSNDRSPHPTTVLAMYQLRDSLVDVFQSRLFPDGWHTFDVLVTFADEAIFEVAPGGGPITYDLKSASFDLINPCSILTELEDVENGLAHKLLTARIAKACLFILANQHTVAQTKSVPLVKRFGKRQKSGWVYKTLTLPLLNAPQQHLGGTHASPRWHVRRGHYRTLKSGRRIFVRACEVGDSSSGGIIKDYLVNPA